MINKLGYIFSKHDKIKLYSLMMTIAVGSFFELMGVTIFMPFINIIMEPNAIQQNAILKYSYDILGFQSVTSYLAAMSGVIIFIYIFKNIYLALEKNAIYKFSYNTQRKLSSRLLTAYMNEPYTFHLNKNIAELQRSMQEDTDLFAKAIIHIMEMAAEICVCVAIGIYLFIVSKSITTLVILLLAICLIIFIYISKKFSQKSNI